jgi:hypothetical protein
MLLALPGVTDDTVTESRWATLLRLSVCAVHEGAFSSTVQLESRFCTGLVFAERRSWQLPIVEKGRSIRSLMMVADHLQLSHAQLAIAI